MKHNKNIKFSDFIKANRHGEWLALFENERGFISKHKIHRSKKTYIRNLKHENYEKYSQ